MTNNKPDYQEQIIVNKKLLFVSNMRIFATFLLMVITFFFISYSNWHYAKPVTGESMQPTINTEWNDGALRDNYDIVLVNRNTVPRRGNIIIVNFNEFKEQFGVPKVSLLIKRVIALSGDTLNMQWIDSELVITVNGEILHENFESPTSAYSCYTTFASRKHISGTDWVTVSEGTDLNEQSDGTITIPEGYYFALGDNRGISLDGSEFGPLPNYTVLGIVDTIVPSGTLLNWILRNIFGIAMVW